MDAIFEAFLAQSGWEMLAVVLLLAYLLLAMAESIWCWACAFFGTAIYTVLFWNVSLLMESALNVYYMAMAFYGWWQWRRGSVAEPLPISRMTLIKHLQFMALIAVLTLLSGYWMSRNTEAVMPYLDSFTTWASVLTTYLVAKKVLENWLYWIVIDVVSIYLYLDRGLNLTAALYVAYVVIAVLGYFTWHRSYKNESDKSAAERASYG